MADYIDPLADPAAVSDMQSQQADVLRQIQLAAMLRRQAGMPGQVGPAATGQMVGSGGYQHYVAPSIWQHVANAGLPVLQQYDAKRAEEAAAEKQNVLSQTIAQMKQKWAGGIPQGTPAQPAIPDQPAPAMGPPTEQGVPPAQVGVIPGQAAVPAAPPTSAQILKHTIAGMNIPGNEKIAEVYNKGALADQTREDTQQFRREESAATRAQQAELKHEQLRQDNLRLAELNRSNKVNEEEKAANHRAMEANVAQMNQWRHEDNQAKAAAAAESAKAKGLKPVPQKVVADLTTLANQVDNIESVTSSFDDSYAGRTGQAMNLAGKVSPWGTEATNWWKDYEKRAALVERHDTFGTALSAGEQTAWKNATIEPGMPAETVRHNLEVRQELARKMYDNALVRQNNASAGQYNVLDVFQPRSNTASATPSGTSIPSPSLKVYTPLRRAVAVTQPAPMKTQTINGVTYVFDGKGWKPQ